MINRLPVQRCEYCGCEDIGLGWQHGEALVTFKKHGLLGNRLRYLICRRCGAVRTSAWLSLTSFHLWGKNAKVAPQNKNKALGVKWHGKKTTVR